MGGGAVDHGCKAVGDVTETDDAPGWDAIDGVPACCIPTWSRGTSATSRRRCDALAAADRKFIATHAHGRWSVVRRDARSCRGRKLIAGGLSPDPPVILGDRGSRGVAWTGKCP